MIPRTKVNYRLTDLIRATGVSDRSTVARRALSGVLTELFDGNVLLSASGRGALYILLMCLPQRRVLIPAYTCKAVVEAARLAGKQIEFGESEKDGFNMDAATLRERLDADTILLVTHQFGIPSEVQAMVQQARQVGAFVIEDAAAALGTRIDGRLTGTFGDAAFFSFDSTKLVNTPLKGGFLLTRDSALQARCEAFIDSQTVDMPTHRKAKYLLMGVILVLLEQPTLYRLFHNLKFHWRGRYTDDSASFVPILGPFHRDRLAEWQASILLPQVRAIEQLVATRRRLYAAYRHQLHGALGFSLPPQDRAGEWAPIRFPILVKGDKLAFYREATRKGVDFAFSFTFLASPAQFACAHRTAAGVLDLPFYDRLSDAELEKVVQVLRELDTTYSSGT